MRIILSRTDSIGDVVLTLPMAAALKQAIPGCTIIFLARKYTRPVVELCGHVDEVVEWDTGSLLKSLHADAIIHVFPVKEICQAAKKAGIPLRIATAGRFFTWFTCNKLLRIPRKNSDLHESQLNLKMLTGLGIGRNYSLKEISSIYGIEISHFKSHISSLTFQVSKSADHTGVSHPIVILHPKSKGSAREWGLENFSRLIDLIPDDRFRIVITGTKEEGLLMKDFLEKHKDRVTDMTGKLSLREFIELIGSAGALVAASTGPLHIAAALGIRAVGLYAPMRPIFPKRWAPVGRNATYLVLDKSCSDCRKSGDCQCIRSIRPEEVLDKILAESFTR
jgi:ADP-heptose:LPS heptosyltransferase